MLNNVLNLLLGAVGPGISALMVTVLVFVVALICLVWLATLVALFGGAERGERARLVLCHLLAVLVRGGDQ